MRTIALLGSTGSVGTQTLEVIDQFPELEVRALAAGKNVELLVQQIRKYRPALVSVRDQEDAHRLRRERFETAPAVVWGDEGLLAVATEAKSDLVVSAVVGALGARPTLAALQEGKTVALANKESLVMAGHLMSDAASANKATILPLDSEHNALFQLLDGHSIDIEGLILTASGGPFWTLPKEAFEQITPEDAVRHPTWDMGRKISVDSATLMNKGLEVIEAFWLFPVEKEAIEVVIHPQSTVHALIRSADGSTFAHLGLPDMRMPIQYALTYPERRRTPFPTLDLTTCPPLEFFAPDLDRFPCLRLAFEALKAGGGAPTVLNASNEVAVELFLEGQIRFLQIPVLVERVLELHAGTSSDVETIEALLEVDGWAREKANDLRMDI